MGVLSWSYTVKRTIFPYDDGYGVVATRSFSADIVMAHGLSKKAAEDYCKELKKNG